MTVCRTSATSMTIGRRPAAKARQYRRAPRDPPPHPPTRCAIIRSSRCQGCAFAAVADCRRLLPDRRRMARVQRVSRVPRTPVTAAGSAPSRSQASARACTSPQCSVSVALHPMPRCRSAIRPRSSASSSRWSAYRAWPLRPRGRGSRAAARRSRAVLEAGFSTGPRHFAVGRPGWELAFHVAVATTAFALLTIGAVLAVLQVMVDRRLRSRQPLGALRIFRRSNRSSRDVSRRSSPASRCSRSRS